MPTALFVRHGRSTANSAGILAGWQDGVFLDETGETQADGLGKRIAFAQLPIRLIVSSPLDRCIQTADRLQAALANGGTNATGTIARSIDERLGECHYGAWTGGTLSELAKDPLWKVIQDQPSEARFPESAVYRSESMVEMQQRALNAVHEIDDDVRRAHGKDAVWIAVSHGDVLKSVLAHAAGAHLDDFQRISVDPGSLSAVHYTDRKPMLLRVNDVGGDLSGLRPAPSTAGRDGDAVIGGSTGVHGEPGQVG